MAIYCVGCSNLYELTEELRRRNTVLTTALKDVRKVQRTPRGGWQGMLNRMVEIIDAALADEQSAGNAGGTDK